MTKTALALAAALIAGTTLTNAAEAGGIRLGFGMPLGSFVASPFSPGSKRHSNYSSGRSSYERMCAQREAKAARAAKIAAAKRQAVANAEEARARKAKMVAKAPETTRDVEVKTAKIETKTIATDAAPTIYVPSAPDTVAAPQTKPSSITTSSIEAEVAKVGEIDDAVKIAAPTTTPAQQTVKVETPAPAAPVTTIADSTEAKPAEKTSGRAERICRRFSAAIAGLVDIPCE